MMGFSGEPRPRVLLELMSDCFGALEAVAYSSIKLARHVAEPELAIDLLVASAVLEFADDLRAAGEAVDAWPCEPVDQT